VKVAFVNQPLDGVLPPDQNSIGIWTYEVAGRIADEHDVTVYARYMGYLKRAGCSRRVEDRGVRYRFSVAAPASIWTRVSDLWERVPWLQSPVYASWLFYLEYCLPIAIRIRRDRPDVVHIHNFTGFVPIIRALNPSVKIVLHMNCEWLSQLDEEKMAKRIAKVDAVLGSSGHIAELVRRRFPQFSDRCHTVYNGVDPDEFAVAHEENDRDDGPVLVFVGRVSPEKGIHDLIDAMSHVVRRFPDVRLDIIGPVGALPRNYIVDVSDDPLVRDLERFYDRDYVSALTDRIGEDLVDRVRFVGSMSHDEVVRHVAAADVLVNPSYSESFGMSLVEAMACETPVVATRVGGMQEIVTDETGVLVERNDPRSLANAIIRLLDDDELRRAMGSAGRVRVAEVFAWDRVAEAALGVYVAVEQPGAVPATGP
jgi:spore coat protein SA